VVASVAVAVLTADATDCVGAADLEATGAVVGAVAVGFVAVGVVEAATVVVFAALVFAVVVGGGLAMLAATAEILVLCIGRGSSVREKHLPVGVSAGCKKP
jgi:hypothetical protein